MTPEVMAERDRIARELLAVRDSTNDPMWRYFLKLCVAQVVYGVAPDEVDTGDLERTVDYTGPSEETK